MPPDFADNLIGLLPNLRRYGLSLSRKADIADDLVQITVERALSNWTSFDAQTRLEPWLFRIMRNAFIDMTRRDRTRGTGVDVTEQPEVLAHDPAAGIEARMMLQTVEQAMETLPDAQREVLHLVCVADLSYAEAAQLLGVPVGTVMSRLSRARIALAEKLGINS
ncbi:RNA polymerase sigma factor [Paracoccus sp. (in: a-proteobacteria)]|uniref:RNA polymerase sigma factor n=1 Tax=Paracoccus sp. TaxID=267 RepID=UPI0026DF7F23|nr:sigma-70 family RNA polymerase sigma factor [Paracoccus sp. (in: a-proteobacteria)]MDO5646608.1 sigma-70 family RNA polymerase sigma factor [Paracoccus sp. (in: a-proteobacteria)]